MGLKNFGPARDEIGDEFTGNIVICPKFNAELEENKDRGRGVTACRNHKLRIQAVNLPCSISIMVGKQRRHL
jgi:hypothetical protein